MLCNFNAFKLSEEKLRKQKHCFCYQNRIGILHYRRVNDMKVNTGRRLMNMFRLFPCYNQLYVLTAKNPPGPCMSVFKVNCLTIVLLSATKHVMLNIVTFRFICVTLYFIVSFN